jgi:hypothetical protein
VVFETVIFSRQDCMALLAYEEPEKSPMFDLLDDVHRERVAELLNGALLGKDLFLEPVRIGSTTYGLLRLEESHVGLCDSSRKRSSVQLLSFWGTREGLSSCGTNSRFCHS